MALMKREDWQDLVGDVDWTLSYVDDEAVFPEWLAGSGKVPREAWRAWDEPYKASYAEYVATQSEKDAAAYAVKAALQRSNAGSSLDEGWRSNAKFHYGATALAEYMGALGELRMARFGLAPRWRNMAVLGALDEIRHTQIALYFAHEFVAKDPQFDWAQKAFHSNDWAIIAARALFDGDRIMADLAANMARPVLWADTMRHAWERGARLALEMPSGSVLTRLAQEADFGAGTALCADGNRIDTLVQAAREAQ